MYMVHQYLVKPWHMLLVVCHPLWSQRMSVSGPRQLRRSGTWLGQYSLKRLIYCGNIAVRSTVGRNSVEIVLRRCWRWHLVWIFFYVTCMYWLYIVVVKVKQCTYSLQYKCLSWARDFLIIIIVFSFIYCSLIMQNK